MVFSCVALLDVLIIEHLCMCSTAADSRVLHHSQLQTNKMFLIATTDRADTLFTSAYALLICRNFKNASSSLQCSAAAKRRNSGWNGSVWSPAPSRFIQAELSLLQFQTGQLNWLLIQWEDYSGRKHGWSMVKRPELRMIKNRRWHKLHI